MPSVTIQPFGEVISLAVGESVLSAVLRAGRFVKYGCKHGGCGTCRAHLVSGTPVLNANTSFALSNTDRESGIVLLCSTFVNMQDLVVDVSKTMMDLDDDQFYAGQIIREYACEVERIDMLTHDIRGLCLRLVDPPQMEFNAGQYAEVAVYGRDDEWRAYSMANPPFERGRLYFIIKRISCGWFSSKLDGAMRPGYPIRLRGPLGQFCIRPSYRKIIMIANGSGLGPIRAMLYDLIIKRNERPVMFLYGVHTDRDLCLHDELTNLSDTHKWLRYIPVLSEPEHNMGGGWDGDVGLVTEAVCRHLPGPLRAYDAYLCGPSSMINAGIEVLEAAGCKSRHIHFDRFIPSG